MTDIDTIQRHVLWAFTMDGVCPGRFIERLIYAIANADSDNLARLRLGFPEYVDAVRAYQTGADIERYPIIRQAIESSR